MEEKKKKKSSTSDELLADFPPFFGIQPDIEEG